ncbi:MAG: hypothetical protein KatS3mg066_0649 [Fischerella sp.]|nr:MAG: hypothetical protein KatS3mg066_0649 [Fischerella sp.]
MNPQPDEDLQQRLRKLEAEIDSSSGKKTKSQQVEQSSVPNFSSVNSQLQQLSNWFNSLSGDGKGSCWECRRFIRLGGCASSV